MLGPLDGIARDRRGGQRRHLGPDRGAHGEQCRQDGEAGIVQHLAAQREIAVHQEIGAASVAARPKVHQHEGEVVEKVGRRQRLVEFERVEHHRPAIDQHDVPEMEVAMAAAHETRFRAPRQDGLRFRQAVVNIGLKPGELALVEQVGPCFQDLSIARRHLFEPGRLVDAADRFGDVVQVDDRPGQLLDHAVADGVAAGEMVERHHRIEAAHAHGIVDGRAIAAEREPAGRLAGDGDDVEVDVGRRALVQLDLARAGPAPLLQRREVHERIAHRALDLVGEIAGEDDDGAMGVDPLNVDVGRIADRSVGLGIEKERENGLLISVHFLAVHRVPPIAALIDHRRVAR